MLKKRVITSIIGLPILVAAVWFDDLLPLFTILVLALGILSFLEFSRLISLSKIRIFTMYGILVTVCFITLRDQTVLEAIEGSYTDWLPVFAAAALILPLPLSIILRKGNYNTRWLPGLWTVAGSIYIGWILGQLVAMRGFEDGRNWVFFTLFATFAYDTSAFFTGRSLGRHRMAPRVSPGKTWEGAAGGTAGAVLISLFFTLSTPLGLPIAWYHALIMGLLISIFGQCGDLLESAFKRYTKVKDSGKALPGHGGFLDRIDSVVFAVLVVYYYVTWVLL